MRLVVGITGATGAIYEDAGVQTDHLISVCARCDLARDRLHGAGGRGSPRHRSMNCLNIARVIVSPGPSHTPRADMVWHDVTVVSKRDGAKAVLCDRFSIKQLSHFSIRTEFTVSSCVLGILDSSDPSCLGALAFGIASLPQQDREQWIGQI